MIFNKSIFSFFLILSVLCTSCGSNEPTNEHHFVSHKNQGEVPATDLVLNANEGVVYYDNILFTGTSVKKYNSGVVAETIEYKQGKRNGLRKKWFENGKLSYEANYISNKLDGTTRSWWISGQLKTESHIVDGKLNGTQKQWYNNGQLFKELTMVDGKESGMQRAWRKTGKLYINYEAKQGRIFGLNRSNLCYELNNEDIVYKD
tara:strand:- start:7122 stop:7733 length:612 start_codon:yes stop_codon:yes gene_type:complete